MAKNKDKPRVYSALTEQFRRAWFDVPKNYRTQASGEVAALLHVTQSTLKQKVSGNTPVTLHEVEAMQKYRPTFKAREQEPA